MSEDERPDVPDVVSMEALARSLVEGIAATDAKLGTGAPQVQIAEIQRLFAHLEREMFAMVGATGARSLAARAIFLNNQETPFHETRALQPGEDRLLEVPEVAGASRLKGSRLVSEEAVAVLTRILSILASVIGDDLTSGMVGRVRASLALSDPHGSGVEDWRFTGSG